MGAGALGGDDAGLGAEGYQVEMNPGVTGLNYQRIKEQLCPDIPYEELEGIYREKTRFHSTASFSSLLFYQRRALRRGGFFMRAPLAAEAMGIIAPRLKELKLIDSIIPEPLGGAHRNPEVMAASLKAQLLADLADLDVLSKDDLKNRRYQRLMSYGYA